MVTWYVTDELAVAFGRGLERTPAEWSRVDETTVRVDHSQERIQVPKRFFPSYKGPAELPDEVRPGPVAEPAQLRRGRRLHLIRTVDPPQGADQAVLYTLRDWEWLQAQPIAAVQALFPTTEQRSTFLGSLTVEECSAAPAPVFDVMSKLFTGDERADHNTHPPTAGSDSER